MAKFKCPYCGAISDKDGICRNCDVGRVVPYYTQTSQGISKPFIIIAVIIAVLWSIFCSIGKADISMFLFILSAAEFIVFLVFLITAIIKRTRKVMPVIGMIVCVIVFFASAVLIGGGQVTTTPISKEDYIDLCVPAEYESIARNPNDYKGEYITFKGTVIQVIEGSTVTLRINQENKNDKWASDTWLITYSPSQNESRILEDDVIIVYGKCLGITSYQSVLGQKITVPSMKMEYYTLLD